MEEQIAKKLADQEADAVAKIRLVQEQDSANAPVIPSLGNHDSILAQQEAESAAKRVAAKNPVAPPVTPSSGEDTPDSTAGPLSIRKPNIEKHDSVRSLRNAYETAAHTPTSSSESATLAQASEFHNVTERLKALKSAGNPPSTLNPNEPTDSRQRAILGLAPLTKAQKLEGRRDEGRWLGGRRKTARGRRRRRTYREPKGLFAF